MRLGGSRVQQLAFEAQIIQLPNIPRYLPLKAHWVSVGNVKVSMYMTDRYLLVSSPRAIVFATVTGLNPQLPVPDSTDDLTVDLDT